MGEIPWECLRGGGESLSQLTAVSVFIGSDCGPLIGYVTHSLHFLSHCSRTVLTQHH